MSSHNFTREGEAITGKKTKQWQIKRMCGGTVEEVKMTWFLCCQVRSWADLLRQTHWSFQPKDRFVEAGPVCPTACLRAAITQRVIVWFMLQRKYTSNAYSQYIWITDESHTQEYLKTTNLYQLIKYIHNVLQCRLLFNILYKVRMMCTSSCLKNEENSKPGITHHSLLLYRSGKGEYGTPVWRQRRSVHREQQQSFPLEAVSRHSNSHFDSSLREMISLRTKREIGWWLYKNTKSSMSKKIKVG